MIKTPYFNINRVTEGPKRLGDKNYISSLSIIEFNFSIIIIFKIIAVTFGQNSTPLFRNWIKNFIKKYKKILFKSLLIHTWSSCTWALGEKKKKKKIGSCAHPSIHPAFHIIQESRFSRDAPPGENLWKKHELFPFFLH